MYFFKLVPLEMGLLKKCVVYKCTLPQFAKSTYCCTNIYTSESRLSNPRDPKTKKSTHHLQVLPGHQLQHIRFLKYTNFGHKPNSTSWVSTAWFLFVGVGIFGTVAYDVPIALYHKAKEIFKVKAASLGDEKNDEDNPSSGEIVDSGDDNEPQQVNKKKKVGFRERKIIEYENRIRHYSTPDKMFRYFATLQVVHSHGDSEIYMTPDDFLRSITPGMKQPDGLGLDQFRRFDPKTMSQVISKQLVEEIDLPEDSVFLKLGSSGLISFSDYIFLLTLLSTSRRHFEIAFRMFDFNGDGDVDAEEFDQVALLLRQNTSVGSRHRDTTGNTFKGVSSALTTYFFGPKRDQKLTIEKFLEFQEQLQREILSLEFRRKDLREDGKLTEVDFAEMLLAYAGYPAKKKARMIKRIRKEYHGKGHGISLGDYLDFFHFLNSINDVDTALTFYHIAGASIEQQTLKHVARTVAHVDLADHVIQVVFTLFDENQDGQLSNREFVAVVKDRIMRGLEKPKDTGFIKLIESSIKCAKQTRPALLDF